RNVSGRLTFEGARVRGYEIHMGQSSGAALEQALLVLDGERSEGAISKDKQVLGTYVHGLFETPEACAALLRWAGLAAPISIDHDQRRERSTDRLADEIERSVSLALLPGIEPTGIEVGR
ncbi:MAG: cobyric acid synthase, partial [Steroidobacteraceae bacterium]